MDNKNCKDCKIHNLIKNQCDESVLQEFIDNYCNKCGNSVKEYTQDEFIKILNNYRVDSDFNIGDIIHIDNLFCDTFKVIDINHDNIKNTIDIIPITQVGVLRFGDNNRYEDSAIRKWLNNVYIKTFPASIQSRMHPFRVRSNDTTLLDYTKILSATEIGLIDEDALDNEGTKYPIFESSEWNDKIESRWIAKGDYGDYYGYWLRSRRTTNSGNVWLVGSSGACSNGNYARASGVLPVLRF